MSAIQRFLKRRERHGRHSKAEEEGSNILSLSLGSSASDLSAEDDQKKIRSLERRIAKLGMTNLKQEHIKYALQSAHAQGDVEKAFDLLLLIEDSIEGIVRWYTPSTKLLGAENRNSVTCYLDALLFAMFARLDCFEAILYKSFNDEPRRKLSILLRLWVNMLRSGKLITTDITKHLQDALAECGWEDAAKLRQQDASEAFTFITEKLELPLLTLKMDIYHTGKEDETGDHKFINERLLEVAIPEAPEGQTLTLEDCLESYFNNKIEVKRYLSRRDTMDSVNSIETDSMSKACTTHIETVEVRSSTSSPIRSSPRLDEATPMSSMAASTDSTNLALSRTRTSSIVQQRFIPDSDEDKSDDGSTAPQTRPRKGSYRKEVMMPAWQFFSLIPWYTESTPTNDAQVAAHFSLKRPILGMCLKRYSMSAKGKAKRLKTPVDIPTEIALPHFIQDDNLDADGSSIYGNFKLSLQAVVCHRGKSVDSGHYISIVRGTSAGAPPANGNQDSNPERYWMRFDDLATERVTLVDIEDALKRESPYLLFYQILPIDEDAAVANLQNKPSSFTSSADGLDTAAIIQNLRSYSTANSGSDRTDGTVSERPSIEISGPDSVEPGKAEQDSRKPKGMIDSVLDDEPSEEARHAARELKGMIESALDEYGEFSNERNVHTETHPSPKMLAQDEREGRSSLSFPRLGSRHSKSHPASRAGSQTSENRLSASLSRFTGRLGKDKSASGTSPPEGSGFTMEDESTETVAEKFSGESDKTANGTTKDVKGKGKEKEKSKSKSREKAGKKPERECLVM